MTRAGRDAASGLAPGTPRMWALFAGALSDGALRLAPDGQDTTPAPADPPPDRTAADLQAGRLYRLGLLRQVLDHQPGGRQACDAAALAAAGLQGPLARDEQPAPARPPDPEPAGAWALCLASWPRPALLVRLAQAAEAARVDAALRRQFPGARGDLALARALAGAPRGCRGGLLAHWAQGLQRLQQADATALDSLRAALTQWQALQALQAGRRAGRRAVGGSGRWLSLAEDGPVASTRLPDGPLAPGRGGAGASANGTPSGLSAPGQPASDKSADKTADFAASPDRSPAPALATPPSARAMAPAQDVTRPTRRPPWVDLAPAANPNLAAASVETTQWHDEWDWRQGRYLRRWTCVRVRTVQGNRIAYLAELQARHAVLLRAIRRHFMATPPSQRGRAGAAADGDQLDLDLALASLIDRRAGAVAEPRPYRHRPRQHRDVCTAVLLDTSGSTGFVVPPAAGAEPVPDTGNDDDDGLLYGFRPRQQAGPAPRRVIDVAHDAIALMCEGMHLLGDRHAIYGFSGAGRLQVDVRVAKRFDQPWSATTAAALAALQPEGSTRTGAAIRFALSQLLAQPAHTRVLVVVTDGYPQDQDYGPDPRDRRHGLQDTAQALREAARAGVSAFCLSVDQAAHDYLRGVCPAHRYLVIDDVHALPDRLSRVYRRLSAA